jgi:hypothetical protein
MFGSAIRITRFFEAIIDNVVKETCRKPDFYTLRGIAPRFM